MRIDNNVGCGIPSCPVDLGPDCMSTQHVDVVHGLTGYTGPAPLKGPYDSSGFPVGCKSACYANLDGDQGMLFPLCTGAAQRLMSLHSQLAQLLLGRAPHGGTRLLPVSRRLSTHASRVLHNDTHSARADATCGSSSVECLYRTRGSLC